MTKEAIHLPPLLPPELVARPVTLQDLDRIFREKEKEALQVWALQKMGVHWAAYFEQAGRNFYVMFQLELARTDWRSMPANKRTPGAMLEIIQGIPYRIPVKLKRPRGFANPFDIFDIKKEYDAVLDRVKKWKKEKGSASQRTLRLQCVLPGLEWDPAWKWRKMKSAEIAGNYLSMTHGFPSGETVKKQLSLARQPMKLVKRILEEFAKEVGLANLVKPPKKAKS